MSKNPWTPGPWDVQVRPLRIASLRPVETTADMQEEEANARLIAAAPEMAELLERLAEAKNGRCESCGCEIAPEGYCGCAPHDSREYRDRVAARALLARVRSGQ